VVVLLSPLVGLVGCSGGLEPVPRDTYPVTPMHELTAADAAALVSLPWIVQGSMANDREINVSIMDVRCFEVLGARVETSASAQIVGVYGRRASCRSAPVRALAVIQLPVSAAAKPVLHAPAASPSSGP